jgi:hypothetical protein
MHLLSPGSDRSLRLLEQEPGLIQRVERAKHLLESEEGREDGLGPVERVRLAERRPVDVARTRDRRPAATKGQQSSRGAMQSVTASSLRGHKVTRAIRTSRTRPTLSRRGRTSRASWSGSPRWRSPLRHVPAARTDEYEAVSILMMRPAVSRGWTHPRYQVLLHAEARVAALDRHLNRLARLERKVDERLVVGCGNEDGEPAESSAGLPLQRKLHGLRTDPGPPPPAGARG